MFCTGQSFICTHVPRKSLHFVIAGSPTKFGFLAYGVYHVPLSHFCETRLFDTFTGSFRGSLFRKYASRQLTLPKLIV